MTAESILLIGAGGHAASCIDVIEAHGRFSIAGLTGTADEVGSDRLGYTVLGTDEDLPRLAGSCEFALVVVGQIRTAEPRARLFARLLELGFRVPSVVSPNSYVSRHASIGDGTIVMHGAIVNARARIGCNCIVNSMALIEHDSVVADHCHIATGAAVNGGATIGAGTFVGSHSSIRQGVGIGSGSVIGMGESVFADCPAGAIIQRTRQHR